MAERYDSGWLLNMRGHASLILVPRLLPLDESYWYIYIYIYIHGSCVPLYGSRENRRYDDFVTITLYLACK